MVGGIEDADKVATYIHGAFYSPEARARSKPATIDFARLTVRQYRNTVADLVGHPQLEGRGRWVEIATPGGPVRAILPPFNIRGAPAPMGAVPRLDEHGDEIRRELLG